MIRNDVELVSETAHGPVNSRADFGAGQIPELKKLMSQFVTGVAALFRSAPGVGGDAGHGKSALGDAAS